MTDPYSGLAILLDNAAPVSRRARLHAETCTMLKLGESSGARKRGMKVIRDDVATSVLELEDMGYPVVRCKCCGVNK